MKRTIWYINHYAGGPGINGTYRAYELCRAWQSQGHDTRVIHASIQRPNQDAHFPANQIIGGVPYTAITTSAYSGNGAGRLLSMAMFAWRLNFLKTALPREAPKPDAIIVSSAHPFGIYAGRRLARKHEATLVFEIRDFWPLSLIKLLNKSRWHPFVVACDITERYAMRHADLVSSVLPRAHLYLEDMRRSVKDYVWAPNGAGEIDTTPSETDAVAIKHAVVFVEEARASARTIIGFAGAMGPPNGILRLVEALELATVEQREKLAILAMGRGLQRAEIESRLSKLDGLETHFTGSLSKSSAQHMIQMTDIGYAGGTVNADLYRYGISPNKLASYMQAGLPVLLPMHPCGDPISESGGGLAAPYETPEKLLDAVLELQRMGPERRAAIGRIGKDYIESRYHYPVIAETYAARIFNALS